MGDENTLATGTVRHKHSEVSSDGGSLELDATLLQSAPIGGMIIALG